MSNDLAVKLDNALIAGIEAQTLNNFARALKLGEATQNLMNLLTPEIIQKFIMPLQNNKLGFKTDNKNGYPVQVVKNCVIEAVLFGLQVTGNQFNIISNNMYATKEGFTYLLKGIQDFSYDLVLKNCEKKELVSKNQYGNETWLMKVETAVNWNTAGEKESRELTFFVKSSKADIDQAVGKAEKRCLQWLHNKITGFNLSLSDEVEEQKEETVIVPLQPVEEDIKEEIDPVQKLEIILNENGLKVDDFLNYCENNNLDAIEMSERFLKKPILGLQKIKEWKEGK